MAPKKSKKKEVKTNSRGRRIPTPTQLAKDKGKLHQRTVRGPNGSRHKQGVMYGTTYGNRQGVAKIGGKKVAYSSRRR